MGSAFVFEDIGEELEFLPLAARRALDVAGRKLSLEAWKGMPIEERRALVAMGEVDVVDVGRVEAALGGVTPAPQPTAPMAALDAGATPADVTAALGPSRPLDDARWGGLRGVERYALWKLRTRPEKLARAYDEIVGRAIVFAHLDDAGAARMVDVAAKAATPRRAVARARVTMSRDVLARVVAGDAPKGDVLAVARIAGIQAAKRTPELIPLCHQIALTRVEVAFDVDRDAGVVTVHATAEAHDRTGVEMEALVAASVASLTIYDMVKSADRWMTIDGVALLEKSGGRSGDVRRPGGAG